MTISGVLSNITEALKETTPERKKEIYDSLKKFFQKGRFFQKQFDARDYPDTDFSVLFGPQKNKVNPIPTPRVSKGKVPDYILKYFQASQRKNQLAQLSLQGLESHDFKDMIGTANRIAGNEAEKGISKPRTPEQIVYESLVIYSRTHDSLPAP
jgi:hypothetical protein